MCLFPSLLVKRCYVPATQLIGTAIVFAFFLFIERSFFGPLFLLSLSLFPFSLIVFSHPPLSCFFGLNQFPVFFGLPFSVEIDARSVGVTRHATTLRCWAAFHKTIWVSNLSQSL